MLQENIQLLNRLPFTFSFSSVGQEDFHYHKEMEMLLVLKGETKCKIHNVLYSLSEGDLLIIDTQDMHRIFDSSPDVLMLDMYIDLQFYTDLYPNIDYMIFACEDYSKTSSLKYHDLQKKVSVLKHHMAEIVLAYINDEANTSLHMESINNLIFTLVNQFQGFFIEDYKFKADTGSPSDIDLNRLYKIIKYIYLNYNKKITLEDLADIVYLNTFYISHLIKNTSGLSFQNFLNYIRIEYAEKLLVDSQMNLTQISESCGFSSLSYFNKCFKTWYKITPAQYRKQLVRYERIYHKGYPQETALSLLEKYILSSHWDKNHELVAKYSHHIFIPVKSSFKIGKPINTAFPLEIFLDKDEDVFMLNYKKNEVKELNPNSIILNYKQLISHRSQTESVNLIHTIHSLGFPLKISNFQKNSNLYIKNLMNTMGIPLVSNMEHSLKCKESPTTQGIKHTVSSAFAYVYRYPGKPIKLTGETNSLFTPQGLLTPFYYTYQNISKIGGCITEQREQYMVAKDDEAIYILIFQKDEDTKLKVHIHINEIDGKQLIIKKSFSKNHSCYKILRSFNNPLFLSDKVSFHINDFTKGRTDLLFEDVAQSYDMNFDVDPDSIMFIEIRKDPQCI